MGKSMKLLLILTCLTFNNIVFGESSIIKMHNGQKYTCVNFYEQPAFQDLSLTLQVMTNITKIQQQNNSPNGSGLKGLRCPIGTVPILDRSKVNVDEFVVPQPGTRPPPPAQGHCNARVQTRPGPNDPSKRFYGANSAITVYKPEVQSSQWSSSRIKLLNGVDSIEAGWMVNPNVFKDNEAHLYASFNGRGKGCINLDCPGFVQVSTDIPLGIAAPVYSTSKDQVLWNISIDKHRDDGNWWLSIQAEKHQIGYWPQALFETALQYAANQVEFGGEINDPGALNPPPFMGNGFHAAYDTSRSSCFFRATVVDQSYNNINPPDTEKYSDCQGLYTVVDAGYQDKPMARLIFYGGPIALS